MTNTTIDVKPLRQDMRRLVVMLMLNIIAIAMAIWLMVVGEAWSVLIFAVNAWCLQDNVRQLFVLRSLVRTILKLEKHINEINERINGGQGHGGGET